MSPMYMAGRFRTASIPPSTLMVSASYRAADAALVSASAMDLLTGSLSPWTVPYRECHVDDPRLRPLHPLQELLAAERPELLQGGGGGHVHFQPPLPERLRPGHRRPPLSHRFLPPRVQLRQDLRA